MTTTKTYTITDAKYLGSKIATDLYQLQRFYGRPFDVEISQYIDEFVILLKDGYLESVDYGFRRNGIWIVGVSYEVRTFSNKDDSPGRITPGKDISGATWGSFLRYSDKFIQLPQSEQLKVQATLPISRGYSNDPQIGSLPSADKTYGSGDIELRRKTFN